MIHRPGIQPRRRGRPHIHSTRKGKGKGLLPICNPFTKHDAPATGILAPVVRMCLIEIHPRQSRSTACLPYAHQQLKPQRYRPCTKSVTGLGYPVVNRDRGYSAALTHADARRRCCSDQLSTSRESRKVALEPISQMTSPEAGRPASASVPLR